eukprot:1370309-Pyramimonas_sp.AAC.1
MANRERALTWLTSTTDRIARSALSANPKYRISIAAIPPTPSLSTMQITGGRRGRLPNFHIIFRYKPKPNFSILLTRFCDRALLRAVGSEKNTRLHVH